MRLSEKAALSRDNRKCKGPEAGASLQCLRKMEMSVLPALNVTYPLLQSGVPSLHLQVSKPHTSL